MMLVKNMFYAVVFLALAGDATAGNLLKNPGFEDSAEGWSRISGSPWKVADGEGYGKGKGLVWENEDPSRYSFPSQRLNLEPGRIYSYSALVRVDSKDKYSNILIGLEWSDRNGKWMGSSYGKPVDDNGLLKDGWVRYEGVTAPMPSVVGKGSFLAAVSKKGVGRVRFDDLHLEARESKVVDFLVTDACRDTVVDGEQVRFLASVCLDTRTRPLSGYAASLTFKGPKGKTIAVEPRSLTADAVEFSLSANDFRRGSQMVRFDVRTVPEGKTIASRSLRFTRLGRSPRRRVSFDSAGRMRVDGKRFFPLGMYMGRLSDADLAVYTNSPFNFAMQYGRMTLADLRRWERLGIFVATDVRSLIYGYNYSAKSRLKTLEESKNALRERYAELGDSSALLMWYLNDEAPTSLADNISEINAFLHEIDPERLTLTCLCHPNASGRFLASYDFLAHDTYPVGWKSGRNNISSVYSRQREIEKNMRSMRPHWFIPQAFSWGWIKTPEEIRRSGMVDVRMPDRAELGNMFWQGIAAGANGILAYSYHSMCRYMTKSEFAASWADICSVAQEIKDMEEVLLSEDRPVGKGLPDSIVARAWRHGNRDWYLVVNRTRKAAEGRMSLGRKVSGFRSELGAGVALASEGDALVCGFGQLGYAVVSVIGL